MGQRIHGAPAIGNAREHDRESHYFAEEGLDLRRLLDALSATDGHRERGHEADPARISVVLHRTRNRLLVAVAVFAYLGLVAVWEIDTIRAAPLAPLGGFILGVVCGAMTGMGFVVRQRWRLYLASRN